MRLVYYHLRKHTLEEADLEVPPMLHVCIHRIDESYSVPITTVLDNCRKKYQIVKNAQ